MSVDTRHSHALASGRMSVARARERAMGGGTGNAGDVEKGLNIARIGSEVGAEAGAGGY